MGLSKQLACIVRADGRRNYFRGAVRAGKTWAAARAWGLAVLASPKGSAHALVGQSVKNATATLIDDNLSKFFGSRLVKRTSFYELCGRRIYVYGAYDSRAKTMITGRSFLTVFADEVNTYKEDFYRFLLSRISAEGCRFFFTCNPEGPRHYLEKELLEWGSRDSVRVFQFTIFDNEFLPEEDRDELVEYYRAAGPMFYDRYILGLSAAPEEAVYPMLEDAVVEAVPEGVEILEVAVGADHGAKSATAFVAAGLGSDGKIYVFDELYWDPSETKVRLSIPDQLEQVLVWCADLPDPSPVVFVDPRASFLRIQMDKDGWELGQTDANVVEGLASVAALMSKGVLRIVEGGCPQLLRELSNYGWDRAADRGEIRPVKQADHAADALRYLVMGTWPWWDDKLSVRRPAELGAG